MDVMSHKQHRMNTPMICKFISVVKRLKWIHDFLMAKRNVCNLNGAIQVFHVNQAHVTKAERLMSGGSNKLSV